MRGFQEPRNFYFIFLIPRLEQKIYLHTGAESRGPADPTSCHRRWLRFCTWQVPSASLATRMDDWTSLGIILVSHQRARCHLCFVAKGKTPKGRPIGTENKLMVTKGDQGIFPTQGSNPGLLHCRWILFQLSHKGSP